MKKRRGGFERVGEIAQPVLSGLTIRVRRPNEPVSDASVMRPPGKRRPAQK